MNFENQASQILKIYPLDIALLKNAKRIRIDKNYFSLIGSNKKNIMITTEKILEERRSGPLIQISDDTFDEECFQQVLSAWVWKRETNNLFIKLAVSQNVLVRPHNITSILNNFIHLIKQVCQVRCTQKISIKSIKLTKSHQFYTKGRKNC